MDWPAPSWVDLFYDLTFAAGIIAISDSYSSDHSANGALWVVTAYAVLGCAWVLTGGVTAAFTSRPRPVYTTTVVLLVIQMAAILLLAVAAGDTIADSSRLFDALFAVVLMICLVLAVPVGRAERAQRGSGSPPRAMPVLVGVAVLALLGSWVLPTTASIMMWWAALAATGSAVGLVLRDPWLDIRRLAHRVGELTLVIIGEILVKMSLTASEETVWSVRALALVPVLAILTTTWWAYFTGPVNVTVLGGRRRVAWVTAHLLLHVALLALAVGLGNLLVGSDTLHDASSIAALLTGPGALVAGSIAVLAWLGGDPSARVLTVAALALAGLAVIGAMVGINVTAGAYALAAIWLVFTAVSRRSPSTAAAPH